MVYLPERPAAGLILFSVGFGGTRRGYGFLARWWASRGYEVAVVEHLGSNLDVLRGLDRERRDEQIRELVLEAPEARDRPQDLAFALCRLRDLGLGAAGLGLAGHSFGAYTAMACAGMGPGPDLAPLAVLAMSWQPPGVHFEARDYRRLSYPTLLLTGTRDVSPVDVGDSRGRLAVLDLLPRGEKFLAVLQGAEHLAFADIGLDVKRYHGPLRRLTSAFWDRYLKGGPPLEVEAARRAVGEELLEQWQER